MSFLAEPTEKNRRKFRLASDADTSTPSLTCNKRIGLEQQFSYYYLKRVTLF